MNIEKPRFVDFKCPHCGRVIAFPDRWSGSAQDCPWCFVTLVVPEHSTEPPHEVRLAVRTERLLLRKPVEADQEDLLEIVSDEDSFRYINWNTMEREHLEDWLEQNSHITSIEPGEWFYFAAERLASPKVVALICFHYADRELRQGGFEVVVSRSYRRQGYGTETCRGTLAFAFGELNLRRVAARCDSRNMPGIKMLEKAGLRHEGECLEDERHRDEWVNSVWFAILSREYNEPSHLA